MSIKSIECDHSTGLIITGRGLVADQELIDCLEKPLIRHRDLFSQYRYILIDNTAVTKVVFRDETVKRITGLCAQAANANPDAVVAMVLNVTMEADVDLIQVISRMHELFVHPTCWETKIFRIRVEALNWIAKTVSEKFDLDGLVFEPIE